jgi:acetylserotonin N-methyltransferase
MLQTSGRERTLEEYRVLLLAAGFSSVEGRVTGSYLDAVLAIR